ncbi:MAG: 3-hydroxyacyl-ACP dehydratase FabZ [Armatimonadetes bacterium]|nr:3-hydroxyacyl-ACP dehydratase FabZ [Candidatus Hippobium faecium]
MLDAQQIKEVLPHRIPFLFVDRVTEMVPGKSIKGYKNISMNEYFFQGHFPGHPILPGVIICEAMAQLSGVLLLEEEDQKGKLAFFAALDQVRFKRPVVPGDRMDMEIEVISFRHSIAKVQGKAFVDGELACEGLITCKIMDRAANRD